MREIANMDEPNRDFGRTMLKYSLWGFGLPVGLLIWGYSAVLGLAVVRRFSDGSTPTADPNLIFFMISLASLFAFLAALLVSRTGLSRPGQRRVLLGAALTMGVFLIATAADILTGDRAAFLAKLEQLFWFLGNIVALMH